MHVSNPIATCSYSLCASKQHSGIIFFFDFFLYYTLYWTVLSHPSKLSFFPRRQSPMTFRGKFVTLEILHTRCNKPKHCVTTPCCAIEQFVPFLCYDLLILLMNCSFSFQELQVHEQSISNLCIRISTNGETKTPGNILLLCN